MRIIVLIFILLFATPVLAQNISPDTINTRLEQLETEKLRLETIYKEIIVRIDELRQLIAPKRSGETKQAEPKEAK